MKIEAIANGNVIEAHPDAAKDLIAAGLYKKYEEPKKKSAEPTKGRKPQK